MLRLCLVFTLLASGAQQGRAQEDGVAGQDASAGLVRVIPVVPRSQHSLPSLRSRIYLNVENVPLNEVARSIADQIGVPIVLDKRSLGDVGLTGEVRVTGIFHGITAASALQILLRDLPVGFAFTYQAGDGFVRVASRRDLTQSLSTRVYRLDIGLDGQRLMELIQTMVHLEAWEPTGGPSSMRTLPQTLIVTTWDEVHEEVAAMLEALAIVSDSDQRVESIFIDDRLDPENQRARAALDKPSGVTAGDYTLAELVSELRAHTGVNVRLDVRALEDSGITADARITVPADGLTVRRLLGKRDSPAFDYGLSYKIRRGVLFMTTQDAAEKDNAAAVFDVRDLVASAGSSSVIDSPEPWTVGSLVRPWSVESLAQFIEHTLDPDIWSDLGGPARITPIPELQCLVVRAPARILADIGHWLDGLRTAGGPVGEDRQTGGGTDRVPAGYTLKIVHVPVAPEQLVAVVKQVAAPDTWDEPGVVIQFVGATLVIQHREEVVAQAMRLVEQIQRSYKRPSGHFHHPWSGSGAGN